MAKAKKGVDLCAALALARVRIGFTRAQAAEHLGVSLHVYTTGERSPRDENLVSDWIKKLERLQVGIKVDSDTPKTPEAVRAMRIKAGLTKDEAAVVVGLSASKVTWHSYERGHLVIPDERWATFLNALRTGSFRQAITSVYRRGPHENTGFVPGEHVRERPEKISLPGADQQIVDARSALRISATQMGELLGLSTAAVYSIEAGKRKIDKAALNALIQVMTQRLSDLRSMRLPAATAEQLAESVATSRIKLGDLGAAVYKESERPGAMLSHLIHGRLLLNARLSSAMEKALERDRLAQVRLSERILERLRGLLDQS